MEKNKIKIKCNTWLIRQHFLKIFIDWRYQRGNQKCESKDRQYKDQKCEPKDRQYKGRNKEDKQWSTRHNTEN
jgi:hypothetical protein